MDFNDHSNLIGMHAFLSASKYPWLRYDDEKLDAVFENHQAARRGTELHEFAHNAIRLGVKLPNTAKTLNKYVNDAIGYRMQSEKVLFYSINCFGTVDAIAFRRGLLRISDLKNGVSRVSMDQLKIYTALFCLEYRFKPEDIETELRIYQNDAVELCLPDPMEIAAIMEKIIAFDKRIEVLKLKG